MYMLMYHVWVGIHSEYHFSSLYILISLEVLLEKGNYCSKKKAECGKNNKNYLLVKSIIVFVMNILDAKYIYKQVFCNIL